MITKLLHFMKVALIIGALVGIGLIIALFGGAFSRGSGSHVNSVSWLPKTASDITYHEDDGLFYHFCYECTMAPEDFQNFARESRWTLNEKRDFHGTGGRLRLGLPPFRVEANRSPNHYPFALVYENVARNGGGIRVIYDPDRQRLFFDESSN
ncbi:hypothetical protein [Prosthecobacter sp.]|uniref:hypothetical protein n=1 Tax=Prosthecobacter sp. TaxID=1965333 RepID=UPI0037852D78